MDDNNIINFNEHAPPLQPWAACFVV